MKASPIVSFCCASVFALVTGGCSQKIEPSEAFCVIEDMKKNWAFIQAPDGNILFETGKVRSVRKGEFFADLYLMTTDEATTALTTGGFHVSSKTGLCRIHLGGGDYKVYQVKEEQLAPVPVPNKDDGRIMFAKLG